MAGIGAKVLRIDALDDEARILKLWRNSDPQNFSERHLPIVAANALRFYIMFKVFISADLTSNKINNARDFEHSLIP
jgi:hypothetical protein